MSRGKMVQRSKILWCHKSKRENALKSGCSGFRFGLAVGPPPGGQAAQAHEKLRAMQALIQRRHGLGHVLAVVLEPDAEYDQINCGKPFHPGHAGQSACADAGRFDVDALVAISASSRRLAFEVLMVSLAISACLATLVFGSLTVIRPRMASA